MKLELLNINLFFVWHCLRQFKKRKEPREVFGELKVPFFSNLTLNIGQYST